MLLSDLTWEDDGLQWADLHPLCGILQRVVGLGDDQNVSRRLRPDGERSP